MSFDSITNSIIEIKSFRMPKDYAYSRETTKYAPKVEEAMLDYMNNVVKYNWAEPSVANRISSILNENDVMILRNQATNTHGLNILGIDDYWAINFKPENVMRTFNSKEANLVLCHNPDVCDLDIWHGYNSWILSGHTHGGQCKPPFLNAPILPVKNKTYDQGKKELSGGRTLYINRAVGHLWQVRFNVRPEITIFKLEAA
jgi:hypothetical protein